MSPNHQAKRDRWAHENLCANCLHPKDDHLEESDRCWCTLPTGTCIFNPCGCKAFVGPTGRSRPTEPVLQNIPIRTDTGNVIRRIFAEEYERHPVRIDLSDIERRIAAALQQRES